MNEEKLYQIALSRVPKIGGATVKNLVSYCGSAKAVFEATAGKLGKVPGIGTILINNIKSHCDLETAQQEYEQVEKNNARILFYTDKEYPNRLKQVYDAPPIIYVTGNSDFNKNKMVAIVGTRNATTYGREFTEHIVNALSHHKATIVSGLAYGIDIAAHKAALKHNLPTIAVMASGLDIVYPAQHKSVAKDLQTNGALVSENPFGTKPDAHRFPARNRIIAGMADAVIVVEAARKGGALITAEIANSYNRDVFAVPGSVGESFSEGCNYLIKTNKAHLLERVEDIEYIMNWDKETSDASNFPSIDMSTLPEKEKAIISLFDKNVKELVIDDISWKSQISVAETASLLLQLEFKGIIKSLPGKKYKVCY